jgi:hypothetical protein
MTPSYFLRQDINTYFSTDTSALSSGFSYGSYKVLTCRELDVSWQAMKFPLLHLSWFRHVRTSIWIPQEVFVWARYIAHTETTNPHSLNYSSAVNSFLIAPEALIQMGLKIILKIIHWGVSDIHDVFWVFQTSIFRWSLYWHSFQLTFLI